MSDEKVFALDESLKTGSQGTDSPKGSAFSIERLLAPCERRFDDGKSVIQPSDHLLQNYTDLVQSTKHRK